MTPRLHLHLLLEYLALFSTTHLSRVCLYSRFSNSIPTRIRDHFSRDLTSSQYASSVRRIDYCNPNLTCLHYVHCVPFSHPRTWQHTLCSDLPNRVKTHPSFGSLAGCLTCLPKCSLRPFQSAQNMAAHPVFRSTKSSQDTPILRQLGWLPID